MSRVLVVEDEQHLADGLRFNLEAEGYQVAVAETGEAALERLLKNAERFDVVILDVMLPAKDGFSVMSELRQAGQFIPVTLDTHVKSQLATFGQSRIKVEIIGNVMRVGLENQKVRWLAQHRLQYAPCDLLRAFERLKRFG